MTSAIKQPVGSTPRASYDVIEGGGGGGGGILHRPTLEV